MEEGHLQHPTVVRAVVSRLLSVGKVVVAWYWFEKGEGISLMDHYPRGQWDLVGWEAVAAVET